MPETGSKDHYFPKFMLRHWCDDRNELWCFDKKTQTVKKKGPTGAANERDLYKSSLANLDLEATIFSELDNRHGRAVDLRAWATVFGKSKRVSNELCHFFIELCLWTSMRNKRVQGWGPVEDITEDLRRDGLAASYSDAELRKSIHLHYCKMFHDEGIITKEIERLKKEFFYFFVVEPDGRFITSDMPVQEVGSEMAELWLDCETIGDNDCSLIMFPLYPELMFVAIRHNEFKDCHRHVVINDNFVDANYDAQINSDSEELYFPYRIYSSSNAPKAILADVIAKKIDGVPCAIDLEYRKKDGVVYIIHSNWDGGPGS